MATSKITSTIAEGGISALPRRVVAKVRYRARQSALARHSSSTANALGAEFASAYARCAPFTLTSVERMSALFHAIRYVDRAGIPGDIVECGVWRGGSSMLAVLASDQERQRHFYLYDTFEGMPEPGPEDGMRRHREWEGHQPKGGMTRAPLEDVNNNILATGIAPERFTLVQGKVEDTLPGTIPERIALLRLDTDWYSSTHHELVHLYPRLLPGGVLIIDDYGAFQGARRAVDEYLQQAGEEILLVRLDSTGRLAVKPPPSSR